MLGACRFCVAISQDLPARAAQSSLVACYYDILILVHHSTFKLIAFRITICFTSFVIMWSYHGVMSSIVIVLVVLLPQVSSSQPGAASHLMGPQLTGSCGEEVGLSRFRGLGFRGLGFRVLWGHQCDLLDCASKAELPSQVGPSCIDGRVPIFESCVAVSLELRKLFLYCALPFSRIC